MYNSFRYPNRPLEEKNRRLKQMFVGLSLECRAQKHVIEKSFKTSDKTKVCQLSDGTICHEHPPGVQDGVFLSGLIPGVTTSDPGVD
jgi:putative transposase